MLSYVASWCPKRHKCPNGRFAWILLAYHYTNDLLRGGVSHLKIGAVASCQSQPSRTTTLNQ